MEQDRGMYVIQKGINYLEHRSNNTITKKKMKKIVKVLEEIKDYDPVMYKTIEHKLDQDRVSIGLSI